MPTCTILAGPNGAGKTTAAAQLVHSVLGIDEFVNADVIAEGLAGSNSRTVSIRAGRLMSLRLRELAQQGADFAFETNLASRSLAPFIRDLQRRSYETRLYFVSLPSAEHAIARVALRVVAGGHSVPDDVIRRRFSSGRRLFLELYLPLVDQWRLLDGRTLPPALVAAGERGTVTLVERAEAWEAFRRP